jgi:hypothetical protein
VVHGVPALRDVTWPFWGGITARTYTYTYLYSRRFHDMDVKKKNSILSASEIEEMRGKRECGQET